MARNTTGTRRRTACISGDVPPGSFGKAALWLRGSKKEVYYNYAGAWRPMDEQNGTWHVRLWVKAEAGTPSFRVRMGGISGAGNQTLDLPVTENWKQHDLAHRGQGCARRSECRL